jgi:hypothetical protein
VVNVANVGKMFTIAVLKSLADHGRSIDTKIGPFLPRTGSKAHTSTPSPSVSCSPTVGFRHDNDRIFETDAAAQEQIRIGVALADKREPVYNINVSIGVICCPPWKANRILARTVAPRPPAASRPLPAARSSNPVGATDATCAPICDPMLFYPPPAVTGVAGSTPPAGPSACFSGGWFMTPASIRRPNRIRSDHPPAPDRCLTRCARIAFVPTTCVPVRWWREPPQVDVRVGAGGLVATDALGFSAEENTTGFEALATTNKPPAR